MILKPPDSVHSPLERGGNYNDKGIGGAPALCAGTPGDVVTPSFHNISPESHWCCRGQPHGRQLWVSFSASTSHPPCPDTHLDGENDGDLGHIGNGNVQRWRWPLDRFTKIKFVKLLLRCLDSWSWGQKILMWKNVCLPKNVSFPSNCPPPHPPPIKIKMGKSGKNEIWF